MIFANCKMDPGLKHCRDDIVSHRRWSQVAAAASIACQLACKLYAKQFPRSTHVTMFVRIRVTGDV